MLLLTTDRYWTLTYLLYMLWCLWMLPLMLSARRCPGEGYRKEHSELPPAKVSVRGGPPGAPQGVFKVRHLIFTLTAFLDVFPVWLVCLGSQHPLHHETTPTKGQRWCYNGDDHGHPSWYQPVMHADGYHMASRASTTTRSESISVHMVIDDTLRVLQLLILRSWHC